MKIKVKTFLNFVIGQRKLSSYIFCRKEIVRYWWSKKICGWKDAIFQAIARWFIGMDIWRWCWQWKGVGRVLFWSWVTNRESTAGHSLFLPKLKVSTSPWSILKILKITDFLDQAYFNITSRYGFPKTKYLTKESARKRPWR